MVITRRGLFGLMAGAAMIPSVKVEEHPPLKYWQDEVDWDAEEEDYRRMRDGIDAYQEAMLDDPIWNRR